MPRDARNDVNHLAYAMNLTSLDVLVPTLLARQTPLPAAPCLETLFGGVLSSGGWSPAAEWQQLGQVAAAAGHIGQGHNVSPGSATRASVDRPLRELGAVRPRASSPFENQLSP